MKTRLENTIAPGVCHVEKKPIKMWVKRSGKKIEITTNMRSARWHVKSKDKIYKHSLWVQHKWCWRADRNNWMRTMDISTNRPAQFPVGIVQLSRSHAVHRTQGDASAAVHPSFDSHKVQLTSAVEMSYAVESVPNQRTRHCWSRQILSHASEPPHSWHSQILPKRWPLDFRLSQYWS